MTSRTGWAIMHIARPLKQNGTEHVLEIVSLVDCLPSRQEALVVLLPSHRAGWMVCSCNASTWEVKAGGSMFKIILSYKEILMLV